MKRKATTWNYCHPDDPHPGLLHLEPPALSGGPSFWIQCGQCGGGTSEELDEIARRVAALWNAAEDLGLTTEKVTESEIQRTFRLVDSKSGVIEAALERIGSLEAEKAEMGKVLLLVKVMIDSHAKHLTRGSGYHRLVEAIKNQGEARGEE